MKGIRKVMAIAGSDSSSGAGLQVDIFTLVELSTFPFTVVTAVTAQNSLGVRIVQPVPSKVVKEQMKAVFADCEVDAVKVGMLGARENVAVVAELLGETGSSNVVVDPVFESTDGIPLLETSAIPVFKNLLLPLATVVTPNILEASALAGFSIGGVADMKRAAKGIKALGPQNVLVKGGHLGGDKCIDVFFDGESFFEFSINKLSGNVRGTGCLLSSAIAAHLAHGKSIRKAVELAREYVVEKIERAYPLGGGRSQTIPSSVDPHE